MALRDVLQAIQAAVTSAMPGAGLSTVTPSAGATGTVTLTGSPFGTVYGVLQILTSGAIGVATAQLSLDNGKNFAAPFTIPSSPAIYQVPLDPVQLASGLVLGFAGTFTQGNSYTWTASAAVDFRIGEEHLADQDRMYPSVVFVPTSDEFVGTEDFAGTQNQTNSARALEMLATRVEAHCWGIDYQRTELLRDQLINGVKVGAPSPARFLSGEWTRNNGELNKAGREYVLTFQFKKPVLELTPPYVFVQPPLTEVLTVEVDAPS